MARYELDLSRIAPVTICLATIGTLFGLTYNNHLKTCVAEQRGRNIINIFEHYDSDYSNLLEKGEKVSFAERAFSERESSLDMSFVYDENSWTFGDFVAHCRSFSDSNLETIAQNLKK